MPPFPERESSLLAKLKKKKGGADDKEVEPPTPPAPVTALAAAQSTPVAKVSNCYLETMNVYFNL